MSEVQRKNHCLELKAKVGLEAPTTEFCIAEGRADRADREERKLIFSAKTN